MVNGKGGQDKKEIGGYIFGRGLRIPVFLIKNGIFFDLATIYM